MGVRVTGKSTGDEEKRDEEEMGRADLWKNTPRICCALPARARRAVLKDGDEQEQE
jgi:hypothetical protein